MSARPPRRVPAPAARQLAVDHVEARPERLGRRQGLGRLLAAGRAARDPRRRKQRRRLGRRVVRRRLDCDRRRHLERRRRRAPRRRRRARRRRGHAGDGRRGTCGRRSRRGTSARRPRRRRESSETYPRTAAASPRFVGENIRAAKVPAGASSVTLLVDVVWIVTSPSPPGAGRRRADALGVRQRSLGNMGRRPFSVA